VSRRPVYTPAAAPVTLLPITGLPEVDVGADLAPMIVDAIKGCGLELRADDVLIVTQKIVSKAEGMVREVDPDDLDAKRLIAESESIRIVRRRGGLVITETKHGFVCANAGIDASNLEPGVITLLPEDPDRSARKLRSQIKRLTGVAPPVIISDTFGRAWRVGQVNVAIGVAGMVPVIDYLGAEDHYGTPLRVTVIAIADELASAAELVMGKADGVPVAIARGVRFRPGRGNARSLVRQAQDDLFR